MRKSLTTLLKQDEVYTYKPYITLNSETYIVLTQLELRSCKKIGNEFYCNELFIVNHKFSYSCESAIYLNPDNRHYKK